ncbi:MAG: hypothetical protein JSS41_01125 [Proteobacteria bacterium]|nr:hypothetical protein [Pseudomonadota bacterium]
MQANIQEPEFVIKATAPRLPRMVVAREALIGRSASLRGCPLIEIVAPDGFGKTTLLLQWRRRWLKDGARLAWLTADARDHPVRFRRALAYALQNAAGRVRVEPRSARHTPNMATQEDGYTGLLAQIARMRSDVVLMLDACERLPAATVRDGLAYLVHNAPSNLYIVLASALPLPWSPTCEPGSLALRIGPDDLRLSPEVSAAVLARHFRDSLDADDAMRLHKACEGWPMGLQLAASAIAHGPALARATEAVVWLRGPLQVRYIEGLLARLPPDWVDFLVRVSILDHLHAQLCAAVTGNADATSLLARSLLETPLLEIGQAKDWSCLHPLARAALLARFACLPGDERRDLHRRAAAWYERCGRHVDSARHAAAAGDAAAARSLLTHVLRRLGSEGRLAEAREELARIAPEEIAADADLRLIAAWIRACSQRNLEALADTRQLLDTGRLAPQPRFVASLVAAAAAAYADRPGLVPGLLQEWPAGSAIIDGSGQTVAFANCIALHALHAGSPGRVRAIEPHAPVVEHRYLPVFGSAISSALVALSHLWEGFPDRAEAVVRPALAHAEQADGRRSAIAGLFAAIAAAAQFERNQTEQVLSLLVGRLDVIESTAIPDAIWCAYRSLALTALHKGDAAQALQLFDALHALACERGMVRLQAHAVAERMRIHALQARHAQVQAGEGLLDALAPAFAVPEFALFRPQFDLLSAIARAHALLARGETGQAERHLLTAHALASDLGRGHERLQVQVLRAVAARQRGAPLALRLLGEALSQGKLGGHRRLLLDSHPLALEMAGELRNAGPSARRAASRPPLAAEPDDGPRSLSGVSGRLLTDKEAQIRRCLGREQGPEDIAQMLGCALARVHWHIGHLCSKLSAPSVAVAVARARLFGLLDPEPGAQPATRAMSG